MNESAGIAALTSLSAGASLSPTVGPVAPASAVGATEALLAENGRSAPPAFPAPSATPAPAPAISAAAQLLSQLLNAGAGVQGSALPLQTLLPAAEVQAAAHELPAARIATALRQQIVQGGLFYESHLGEWVAGERGLDSVRQEPQGRLSPSATGIDPTAASLVRQQLDLLDAQPLQWRGELCPGVPVALQLAPQPERWPGEHSEQDTNPQGASGDEPPAWRSVLVSTLPRLGEVTVRLQLVGDRLQLAMQSPTDDTAALLTRHLPELGRALGRAGLALESASSHGRTED